MRKHIIISMAIAAVALGQTQLDLRTQTKASTRPIKTGVSFPGSCLIGEVFLKTDAPEGTNLYACIATNHWVQQGTGSGGGSILVASDGAIVGSENTHNFVHGNGVLKAISDTGTRIDIAHMIDSAVVQTHANAQSGRDLFCESTVGSDTHYVCSLSPTLTALTKGSVINWKPDVTGAGGATMLTIDALNAIAIKLEDGVFDPAPGDIRGGEMMQLWYDGTFLRMLTTTGYLPVSNALRPECNSTLRGRIWFAAGAPGIKDDTSVCAKDGSNQYAWRSIY
jgi:hypothetical protein